jgi:hypothetical protein
MPGSTRSGAPWAAGTAGTTRTESPLSELVQRAERSHLGRVVRLRRCLVVHPASSLMGDYRHGLSRRRNRRTIGVSSRCAFKM